ncbi:uncharacterized protein LOC128451152 isoform X5 [Pleuronectes platessa]|uniref:uncharacterized protein LOC128451152 isoform X5 n=1 Tax=Pleuronectes platessa TaxID=8262 RepID=UPI00232A4B83|nr:uncharacterized protein LOC128451152 isoform X5 [Pleuronectes platessa]
MSAELHIVSGPDVNDASLQGNTVGGSKPLHRFMKGQPKAIGVVVLVLGSSFFIISVAMAKELFNEPLWRTDAPVIIQGILFIICGIMYILAEHNPTKKTAMGRSLEWIFVFYTFVSAIILIVMSTLAGAALRSTKSQAVVMMTAAPPETPAE